MMSNKNHSKSTYDAAKASVAYIVCSFIVRGISFITTPIFTRIIDSEQYGLVTNYNSWLSIIEVFSLMGLTYAGVLNVGLKDHDEDRDQFLSTLLVLCNIFTLCTFTIIYILRIAGLRLFTLPIHLLIVMFVSMLFSPARIFWMTRQRYIFRYKSVLVITIVSTMATNIFGILAIIWFKGSSMSLGSIKILSTTFATLLFDIPIYILLMTRGRTIIRIDIWRETLFFALPLLPHYIAQHIMNSSDRIMIHDLYSASGAAIYSVASNIGMIAFMLWTAVNGSMVPLTFEKIKVGKAQEINSLIIPSLCLFAIACIGVALFAPEAIALLAPIDYRTGIYAVPPIAANAILCALYNIYSNIEFYYKKSWWITLSTIVATIVNIILNFILIPRYGFIAAAYTTLVAHITLVIMHFIGYKQCKREKIYNDIIILGIAGFSIMVCVICTLFYRSNSVRFSAILLLGLIIVYERKKIFELVNLIKK